MSDDAFTNLKETEAEKKVSNYNSITKTNPFGIH